MGVLNVTPDSFYDGGRYTGHDAACERAARMAADGADIIDIGGESSRPGSSPVTADEEIRRVVPVIESIAASVNLPLAIDTRKAEVARAALSAGASIVNDISAMADPEMAATVTAFDAGIVLMHIHGEPGTMQDEPLDEFHVLDDVLHLLEQRTAEALDRGIKRDRIALDPGIGFGKTFKANELLINHLDRLKGLGFPILIGASRKKFIGERTGRSVGDRLAGSLAAHVIAFARGAAIFRVHDVMETKDALTIVHAIIGS